MLNIDGNQNITLTRGDTLTLTVSLLHEVDPIPPATEPTVEPYVPQEGDVIRFAVSKGYKGEPGYELKFSKVIPHDTLTFTASSTETALDYRDYNYDVEITFADGAVDTFISGKLTIVGEAK
ncbi:MAG: hypothetical protein IJH28_05470 [Mogibacterium sp.]|nr:hypothetical protein [Mogibacterium sp.]